MDSLVDFLFMNPEPKNVLRPATVFVSTFVPIVAKLARLDFSYKPLLLAMRAFDSKFIVLLLELSLNKLLYVILSLFSMTAKPF